MLVSFFHDIKAMAKIKDIALDREHLINEKQNNKASAKGMRFPKEAMLLRDIYKAIPRRVSSFWTHQQSLPRAKKLM